MAEPCKFVENSIVDYPTQPAFNGQGEGWSHRNELRLPIDIDGVQATWEAFTYGNANGYRQRMWRVHVPGIAKIEELKSPSERQKHLQMELDKVCTDCNCCSS